LKRKKFNQVHPQKYFKTTSFDDVFLNLYDFLKHCSFTR